MLRREKAWRPAAGEDRGSPTVAADLEANFLYQVPPMLSLLCGPAAPSLRRAGLFNASRLGLRRFFSAPSAQPPQGWVPTPYVTETVVR